MPFRDEDLTRDVFLDGALRIWQPKQGYRAATDPVLLAAAVEAIAGQDVLELGCGAGTALLSLGRRVAGLSLSGVELQPAYAELARRNADENGLRLDVTTADFAHLPAALKRGFDHVLANPPYYASTSPAARDAGRDMALREETPLAAWVETGLRRLKPGGTLTLIHLAERLPDILAAIGARGGSIRVRPLTARAGREAGRVIVQARKGAKGPFRLLAPLVLHAGDRHERDGDDFTDVANGILRQSAPLLWT